MSTYYKLSYFFILHLVVFSVFGQLDGSYFQQKVDITIQTTLDTKDQFLNGDWKMVYSNNSSDTLHQLYMHLWANAYKDGTTAFAQENEALRTTLYDNAGFIDSLDFKSNGKSLNWHFDTANAHIDVAVIHLDKPLFPGASMEMNSPFRVKLPPVFSRMGVSKGTYQISQWFPKPAVYDREGWHAMPYLDQGEFYSEFGDYDVTITLPKDYVVAATGELQTESERAWLDQRVKKSAEVIEKFLDTTETYLEYKKDGSLLKAHYDVLPKSEMKTIRYKASNVHDFAWFADRTWLVQKRSFVLPQTKKSIDAYAMHYPNTIKLWKDGAKFVQAGIEFYSEMVGPYPYSMCTAVEGALEAGGGMEYPMVTVIAGGMPDAATVEQTVVHEVGHNWFQGMIGTNEREHPYMDEGINTFYEKLYLEKRFNGQFHYLKSGLLRKLLGKDVVDFDELVYFYQAKRMADQPINLPADEYTAMNYGSIVYYKSSVVFNYLREYLGHEPFDSIMQSYFKQWQYKHPGPDDLKKAFDPINKDLSFFFQDILSGTAVIDYKIMEVDKKPKTLNKKRFKEITIRNKGRIRAPFSISSIKNDTVVATYWFDGFLGEQKVAFPYDKKVEAYQIDAQYVIPDINRKNNYLKTKGLMKRSDGISLKPLFNIENPTKTEIVWAPIAGYNTSDGTMLGLALYNGFMYEKPFEVAVAPLYSGADDKWNGTGRIAFNLKADETSGVRNMVVGMNFTSFNYGDYSWDKVGNGVEAPDPIRFTKIMPYMRFNIKNPSLSDNIVNYFKFRTVFVNREIGRTNPTTRLPELVNETTSVIAVNYFKQRYRKFDEYKYDIGLEMGDAFIKGKVDISKTFSYRKDGKGLDARFFIGSFLMDYRDIRGSVSPYTDIRYRMAGGDGANDYLFDDVYVHRNIPGQTSNESIWGHHRYVRDGGFRIVTSAGRTSDWLMATNLDIHMPMKMPFKFFVDLGTTSEIFSDQFGLGGERVLWNMGAKINLGPLTINMPLAFSQTIRNDVESGWNSGSEELTPWKMLGRTMTFNLNITEFNPIRLREKLLNL